MGHARTEGLVSRAPAEVESSCCGASNSRDEKDWRHREHRWGLVHQLLLHHLAHTATPAPIHCLSRGEGRALIALATAVARLGARTALAVVIDRAARIEDASWVVFGKPRARVPAGRIDRPAREITQISRPSADAERRRGECGCASVLTSLDRPRTLAALPVATAAA